MKFSFVLGAKLAVVSFILFIMHSCLRAKSFHLSIAIEYGEIWFQVAVVLVLFDAYTAAIREYGNLSLT